MSQTVLVTGATGLAGANICKQLTERGDHVRALARETADTAPLAALGVEVVTGDVTDADAVVRAARGRTPPSTAPRCWAAPARTWPTSRRSTSTAPRTCSMRRRSSTWAGWWR